MGIDPNQSNNNQITSDAPELEEETPVFGTLAWMANTLGALLIGAMFLNVLADVTLRYVANKPIQGTIELVANWWMAPLSFISIAVAAHLSDHVRMTMVTERASGRLRFFLDQLADCSFACVMVGFAWFGWLSAQAHRVQGESGMASGLVIWPARYFVPVGCAAALWFTWRVMHRREQSTRNGAMPSSSHQKLGPTGAHASERSAQ